MDPSLWLHQRASSAPLSPSPDPSLRIALAIPLVIFGLAVWLRVRARRRALRLQGMRPERTEALTLISDAVAVVGSLMRIPLFAFGLMTVLGRLFLDLPNSGPRRF